MNRGLLSSLERQKDRQGGKFFQRNDQGLAWVLFLVVVVLSGCDDNKGIRDLQRFVAETKSNVAGKPLEALPDVQPYYPFEYTAQSLKDPFLPAKFVIPQRQVLLEQRRKQGPRPNMKRKKEVLEQFTLAALQMVGTVRLQGKTWGLIRAPNGTVYRVRRGHHVGTDHGRIINVTDKRIEVVEFVKEDGELWAKRKSSLVLIEAEPGER